MKRLTRYQGAIIRDDQVLLLKVVDRPSGQTFWLIPGGGREEPESEEACVQREMREETELEVAVRHLLLDVPAFIDDDTYTRYKTYLCEIISGEARPGLEPEVDGGGRQTIRAVGWFDLRDPARWPPIIATDPYTGPQLRQLRAALGYADTAGER